MIRNTPLSRFELFQENLPLYLLWGISLVSQLFFWYNPFPINDIDLLLIALASFFLFSSFGKKYIKDTLDYRRISNKDTRTIRWIRKLYIFLVFLNSFTYLIVSNFVSYEKTCLVLFFGIIGVTMVYKISLIEITSKVFKRVILKKKVS